MLTCPKCGRPGHNTGDARRYACGRVEYLRGGGIIAGTDCLRRQLAQANAQVVALREGLVWALGGWQNTGRVVSDYRYNEKQYAAKQALLADPAPAVSEVERLVRLGRSVEGMPVDSKLRHHMVGSLEDDGKGVHRWVFCHAFREHAADTPQAALDAAQEGQDG